MNRQIRRNKKIKNKNINMLNKNIGDEENSIKRFMIIVGVMLLVLLGIYIITDKVKNKEEEPKAVEINYDIMNIGGLLNGSYDNYYVLIYNSKSSTSGIYKSILDNYEESSYETDHKKMYYIDLDNKLNSSYYNVNDDDKSNPDAKSIKELDLGDLTLIEVKNKKIVNYIEDFNKILKELNINN